MNQFSARRHEPYTLTEFRIPMSDLNVVELNGEQRDLLLRSLRYIRSSVLLRPELPTEESVQKRTQNLQEVEALISHLNDSPKTSTVTA